VIENIAPDRQEVEQGLLRVFVEGRSFCSGLHGCGKVLLDGIEQPTEVWGHNQLMFIIPDPVNADRELTCVVVVDGVPSAPKRFKKPVPNFNALVDQGRWYEMDTLGGETFYIAHVFDVDTVDASEITIRFGAFVCQSMRKTQDTKDRELNTYTLECVTPPGVGADLDVIVEVPGGRSRASELKFSYKPPEISSVQTDATPSVQVHDSMPGSVGVRTRGERVVVLGKGFGSITLGRGLLTLGGMVDVSIIDQRDDRLVAWIPEGTGAGLSLE